MREFLNRRQVYLYRILQSEGLPAQNECILCNRPGRWRCKDCLGQPLYCRMHCREYHQQHICHRLQCWNGRFFADRDMWEVGVRLFLGHGGKCCPQADPNQYSAGEGQMDLCAETDNSEDTSSNLRPNPSQQDEPQMFPQHPPEVVEEEDEDDDLFWDDVEDTPRPPLGRHAPAKDRHGNQFILIVDSSGLFRIPAVYCSCVDVPRDFQLLDLSFFPTSFENIKTVFTFRCLDDFRLSNLECKTSAYQYFQRLRRLTNPAFPNSVPNRYAELRRLSRQWRNLKLRKWFGFGHRPESPGTGQMALFCAACPQPDVNLPEDWQERYTV